VGARGRAICGSMMWMPLPEHLREREAAGSAA
jgi:hypothetical protein